VHGCETVGGQSERPKGSEAGKEEIGGSATSPRSMRRFQIHRIKGELSQESPYTPHRSLLTPTTRVFGSFTNHRDEPSYTVGASPRGPALRYLVTSPSPKLQTHENQTAELPMEVTTTYRCQALEDWRASQSGVRPTSTTPRNTHGVLPSSCFCQPW